VFWTPALEAELTEIFRQLRYHTPAVGDCSTPELLSIAASREGQRQQAFLKAVRQAIERTRPAAIDLDCAAAVARLEARTP
jgi:hypothetical protein